MLNTHIALKRILKRLDELKCIYSTLICFLYVRLLCFVSVTYKQFSQFYIGCTKRKKKATMYIAAYMKFENKIKTD